MTSSSLASAPQIHKDSAALLHMSTSLDDENREQENSVNIEGEHDDAARSTASDSDKLSELGVEALIRPHSSNSGSTEKGRNKVSFEANLPKSGDSNISHNLPVFSGIDHMNNSDSQS